MRRNQPTFDAKMRQLFSTNKSVVFQLSCVQVICGSLQYVHKRAEERSFLYPADSRVKMWT